MVDFLEIAIEDDDSILGIVQGTTFIADIIDFNAIRDFIKDWNEEYCSTHDLCPECRAKLTEMFVDVPYGDTTVQEIEGLRCPYCG